MLIRFLNREFSVICCTHRILHDLRENPGSRISMLSLHKRVEIFRCSKPGSFMERMPPGKSNLVKALAFARRPSFY